MSEEQKKQNLNQAQRASSRQNDKARQGINTAKNLTPMGALSLAKQIEITDFLFVLPLMAAMLKDVLDIVQIGSLPAIGTVITFCCSIFIGLFMLLLGGGRGKRKAAKVIMRYLLLIGGTAVEGIFYGVNFLPIETILVIIIYYLILIERKEAASEEALSPQESYA